MVAGEGFEWGLRAAAVRCGEARRFGLRLDVQRRPGAPVRHEERR